MRKSILTFFTAMALLLCVAGCHIFQPDVQQGNVLNDKLIQRVKVGMSKTQVERMLGKPILQQPFTKNRVTYVYTFKSGESKKPMVLKKLQLTFYQNRLIRVVKGQIPAAEAEFTCK